MEKGNRWLQWAAGISAATSMSMLGCFLGWISPTLTRLEEPDSTLFITSDEGSWIASINSLTMVIAILAVPYTVDRVGRKKLLLAGALPYIVNWLLAAFANSFGMLMAARVIGSLGVGVTSAVCPMYLAEIGDTDIRGTLGTLYQMMTNFGTLFIYCVGPYVSVENSALISIALPALFFITFVWMPDSPYFYMLRGREEDATKELLKLKGRTDASSVKGELEQMRLAIRMKQETKGSFKDLFLQPGNRRTLLLVTGLSLLQMCSGSIALMTYTTVIFESSNSDLDSNVSSIIVASVQLVMGVVSSALVDRVGRRPLMIGSFTGCWLSHAAVATYFLLEENIGADVSAIGWLPLAGLICFQISFAIGLGSVLYAIIGEIFHVSVKGLGASVVTMLSALTSFTIKKLFQIVADSIGTTYNFWFFSIMCLFGAIYSYFLLPETNGKTFAEINDEMDAKAAGLDIEVEKSGEKPPPYYEQGPV